MAFVPGRSISEHYLLDQEMFHKFKVSKNKKGAMAIKLDMEQAYDSMGFDQEREDSIELINWCSGKTVSALAFVSITSYRLNEEENGFSNWVMKLKLNKKVEIFWWRLGKRAIPTNLFLKNRNLYDFVNCARGCKSIESYEHIIVHCKYMVEVIMKIREWGIHIPIFHSLDNCLQGLEAISMQNSGIVRLYCTVIYLSWRNRNEVKHQKPALSCFVVASNALYLATSNSNPFLVSWGTNLLRESHDPWCPPPKDWIKINVDASLLTSNLAGIGGIFRDFKGKFISAFGKKKIHWDIAQLEQDAVLAVKEFLCDWMLECKGILVESDM
ncbi:uncharacterized protein LOC110112748 [Dendrobium catenatum]|uniref:uncharacterized protein LOC110112748 n=1 Tax=Dendrobium catenatum TaxID=906689 RepID=UPI0009F61BC8|nr:uncharacterized protein LOC110112748 [Dendrobium catenatum]